VSQKWYINAHKCSTFNMTAVSWTRRCHTHTVFGMLVLTVNWRVVHLTHQLTKVTLSVH